MKSYLIKMVLSVLIISSFTIIREKNSGSNIIAENVILNNAIEKNDYVEYTEPVIYEGLTLKELGVKIDNVFNSTLDGYGEIIVSKSLEREIDPVIAASIILVETGCKWKCSRLVRNNNNVGGMRGSNGYLKFATLDDGIQAFINNLAKNYYQKGLTTPELMNKKYAANPNWHKDVYYYVNLIKAS